MDPLKEYYIKELWQHFLNRIQDEWQEKYKSYGNNLASVEMPTKFAQAIYADMSNFFHAKKINIKVMNYLTLHSYFQQGGLSVRLKAGTLDIFSMYLGHENFTDFIEKNKKEEVTIPLDKKIETQEMIKQEPILVSEFTPPNPIVAKTKKRYLSLIISISFIIIAGLFVWHKSINSQYMEEAKIVQLIEAANTLEFSLYKSVPYPEDTTKLYKYFTNNSPAIQVIKGYLENALRNERKLRMPGSFFTLVSVEPIRISEHEAFVKTKERWRTLWYKSETNKNEKQYDILNEQIYHLKKINGSWKIYLNDYEGKAQTMVN